MADIKSYNALDGGDGGSGTSTSPNTTRTFYTTSDDAEYTVFNPGIDEDSSITEENGLRSIQDFKEAADLINGKRTEVKTQMQNLTKNLYSTLNQINFSFKLILDTNYYLTRYTNNEINLKDKLKEALETEGFDTPINMYDNVTFNNIFIFFFNKIK